ncbi:MAG: hypothetical protein AABX01_04295 [Candidatus Micrarchaeota archaeon]
MGEVRFWFPALVICAFAVYYFTFISDGGRISNYLGFFLLSILLILGAGKMLLEYSK